jgi:hypothetical protein
LAETLLIPLALALLTLGLSLWTLRNRLAAM